MIKKKIYCLIFIVVIFVKCMDRINVESFENSYQVYVHSDKLFLIRSFENKNHNFLCIYHNLIRQSENLCLLSKGVNIQNIENDTIYLQYRLFNKQDEIILPYSINSKLGIYHIKSSFKLFSASANKIKKSYDSLKINANEMNVSFYFDKKIIANHHISKIFNSNGKIMVINKEIQEHNFNTIEYIEYVPINTKLYKVYFRQLFHVLNVNNLNE